MEVGQHFTSNQNRLVSVTEREWAAVLNKCNRHTKLRIKQKMLFGAHTEKNLGEDPIHHYISYAYEALISGQWEWQSRFDLAEQMIRIINSRITTEVEKTKTDKASKLKIDYKDIETELYFDGDEQKNVTIEEKNRLEKQIALIEAAVKGDENLEFFWEGVKERRKRAELAELMDLQPKQLDKLKERFVRTVRKYKETNGNDHDD